MAPLIYLQNISKSFGPVKALHAVSMEIRAGEVLALVGENGAGKSTLMKILGGVYPYGEFEGKILNQDGELQFRSPKDSERAAIALIHQELSTFPHLSVAENIVVGHWPTRNGLIERDKIQALAFDWLKKLDADFSPDDRMSSLSTGQQQVVEIAKALSRDSKVLILDEPTSSLTSRETKKLFALIKDLKDQGCGLVYISHRMEEIFSLTDRVVVLRDGQSVFTASMQGLSEEVLIQNMVGRKIEKSSALSSTKVHQEPILKARNFSARNIASGKSYGPVSFAVSPGEILGFSGLLGAGRSEILQAMCGDQTYNVAGDVLFKNSKAAFEQLRLAYRRGFGLVPEDRKVQSILPTRSLNENAGLVRLSQKIPWSWVSSDFEDSRSEQDLKILNTRFHSTDQKITELSGGNQQKVIFARVLQNQPDVLILDEPTRGVDVGAKFEIYQLIRKWASEGKAIIVVSSDLPELMGLSDRILVMASGQIRGELLKDQFNEESIMKLAIQTEGIHETVS